VHTTHTQFNKTHNYWLGVSLVLCTKVVDATSSEGFLAYYTLLPIWYYKGSLDMLQTTLIDYKVQNI